MKKIILLNIISVGFLLTGCTAVNTKMDHLASSLGSLSLQKTRLKNGTTVILGYLEPAASWNCRTLATLPIDNTSFQFHPFFNEFGFLRDTAIAYANKTRIKPNYISLIKDFYQDSIGFYQCQQINSYYTTGLQVTSPKAVAKSLGKAYSPANVSLDILQAIPEVLPSKK